MLAACHMMQLPHLDSNIFYISRQLEQKDI